MKLKVTEHNLCKGSASNNEPSNHATHVRCYTCGLMLSCDHCGYTVVGYENQAGEVVCGECLLLDHTPLDTLERRDG